MYLCGIALANQSNAGCGEIVNPLGEKPDPKLRAEENREGLQKNYDPRCHLTHDLRGSPFRNS